jgi:hypothetical protein
MSDPNSFDFAARGPTRKEFDELLARQNQIAVRCIALESVVRNLGAFLHKAMPPATAERFLESLGALGAAPTDANMPEAHAQQLRGLVEREQRHIIDLIREQNGPIQAKPSAPGPSSAP